MPIVHVLEITYVTMSKDLQLRKGLYKSSVYLVPPWMIIAQSLNIVALGARHSMGI